MIITRDIINKNIKFHDVHDSSSLENLKLSTYNFDDLSRYIDTYKNLLLEKGAQPGDKVIIGEKLILRQIASVFACAELALDICIVNNVFDQYANELKQLLPIKFVISELKSEKVMSLVKLCEHIITPPTKDSDCSPNRIIYAKPYSNFLSCVSHGKNGKLITHSHEFIARLIKRNSNMLYGKVAFTANLNHGSSPAAYFLPSLVSNDTTDCFVLLVHLWKLRERFPSTEKIFEFLNENNIKIDHIMLSNGMLDHFLNSNIKQPQLNLYILSPIISDWIEFIKNKSIKDIISIFGTSECSGPLLINKGTDICFNSTVYRKLDDFYNIGFTNNSLTITMPVYNKIVNTGDNFEFTEDGRYKLTGMNFIPRINDYIIDISSYKQTFKNRYDVDVEFVLDSFQNNIYLIIWDKIIDESIIKNMDAELRKNSDGLHFISAYKFLNKEDSLYKKSLLEYFKNE